MYLSVDLKHQANRLYTTVHPYWKHGVGFIGVAVLVTALWGKVALIGVTLVGFAIFSAFGPMIRVIRWADLSGMILATALFANIYFKLLNPKLMSFFAACCILAREVNFWGVYNELSKQYGNLNSQNAQLKINNESISGSIAALRAVFVNLNHQMTATEDAREKYKENISPLRQDVQNDVTDLKTQLEGLIQIARIISSDEAMNQRLEAAFSLEKNIAGLLATQKKLNDNQADLIQSIHELRDQLEPLVTKLNEQETLKTEQIKILMKLTQNLNTKLRCI